MRIDRQTRWIAAASVAAGAWWLLAAKSRAEPARAAAEKEPARHAAAKPSLDDELLDELLGDSAEEDGEAEKPARRAAPRDSLDDELLKGLEADDGEMPADEAAAEGDGEADKFTALNRRMREIERRIADGKSDDETQKLQREAAEELQRLVDQMQQRCRQGAASRSGRNKQGSRSGRPRQPDQPNGGKSDEPAEESTENLRDRQARKPDPAEMRDLAKAVWGQLPEHLRLQMEQSPLVEFLPKYELLIEDYFKALSRPQNQRR